MTTTITSIDPQPRAESRAVNINPNGWSSDEVTKVAHAEVVAVPCVEGEEHPDGAVQMKWTDETGYTHHGHLVKWWRLDRQGLGRGVELSIDVQARQRRDLSCPPHHISATLVVTGDLTDQAQVLIGDPNRRGSWAYGVLFHGAVLTSTSVLIDD